jgi:hypothetical protein
MADLERSAVLCIACHSSGLDGASHGCIRCESAGAFHRLTLAIKIVTAADLSPVPDITFQRMAVLSAQREGERVLVRGLTDRGTILVAAVPANRFAEILDVEFVEGGRWW